MEASAPRVPVILMILALALQQLSAPVAGAEGSTQVVVEVFGSLLVVDFYACLNESYASLEAIGSPLSVLQVTPQGTYVAIEGGRISVLTLKQPECVRVRYVSEAANVGNALRVFYPKRVSKMTLLLNLSSAVPVYISPEPSDAYLLGDNSIAVVWLEVAGITVDYVVVECPRERTAPPTLTVAPPPEETVTVTYRPDSPRTQTPTGQTPTASYGTVGTGGEARREDSRALIVLAVLVVALAVVALILRLGR